MNSLPDGLARLRLHSIINKGLQCNRPQLAYCKSHWHEYMAVSTRALGQRDWIVRQLNLCKLDHDFETHTHTHTPLMLKISEYGEKRETNLSQHRDKTLVLVRFSLTGWKHKKALCDPPGQQTTKCVSQGSECAICNLHPSHRRDIIKQTVTVLCSVATPTLHWLGQLY